MSRRTRRLAMLVFALATLLGLAACGSSAPKPAASASPVSQPASLGVRRLVSTTGRLITLEGSAAGSATTTLSRPFRLTPPYTMTYWWSTTGFGTSSLLKAYLAERTDMGGGHMISDHAGLMATTHGDPSSGEFWSFNAQTDASPSICVVHVAARRCRWSLSLLIGGRSVMAYTNAGYRFSIRYDPTRLDLEERLVRTPTAGASAGLYVSLKYVGPVGDSSDNSGATDTSFDAVVFHAAKGPPPSDSQVRASIAKHVPGLTWVGGRQAVAIGGLSGYRLEYRYDRRFPVTSSTSSSGGSTETSTTTKVVMPMRTLVYVLASGGFWYEIVLEVSRDTWPAVEPTLMAVVRSFRVTR